MKAVEIRTLLAYFEVETLQGVLASWGFKVNTTE